MATMSIPAGLFPTDLDHDQQDKVEIDRLLLRVWFASKHHHAIRLDVLRVRQSDKATIGFAHAWLPVACFHGGAPLHTVHLQWHTVAAGNSFYTAAAAPRKHLLNVTNVNSSSSSKKATVA